MSYLIRNKQTKLFWNADAESWEGMLTSTKYTRAEIIALSLPDDGEWINQNSMTLGDHAESWNSEQGNSLPTRGTPEWRKMYDEFMKFAFQDFGKQ